MGKKYNSSGYKGKTHTSKAVNQIKDYLDLSNIGITLWTEETLQQITKLSGTLAIANEYQIHYWALNARKIMEDGSVLDISIPTVLFNYKQEVSGSHIDFELKDVEEVSTALEPLHNAEVNKLLPLIQKFFKEFEFISVPLNTLHRHPGGRSQSFSSTDLSKDHTYDTGVVFPLSNVGDNYQASFSSIIAQVSGTTYLAHSEYRLATGAVTATTDIKYYTGRCGAYVKGHTTKPSGVEGLFGITPTVTSYTINDELPLLNSSDFFKTITAVWDGIDYQPNTQFIKDENLSKKTYTNNSLTKKWNSKTKRFEYGTSKESKDTDDITQYYQDMYDTDTLLTPVDFDRTDPAIKDAITAMATDETVPFEVKTFAEIIDMTSSERLLYMQALEGYRYTNIYTITYVTEQEVIEELEGAIDDYMLTMHTKTK